MAACKATKVKEERQQHILDTLKKNPGKSVTTKSLQEMFNISYAMLWQDLKDLKEIDNNVVRTKGAVSYNGPSVAIVVKPERYKEAMNSEGYNDPTANAAIKSVSEKLVKKSVPKVNEVWEVTGNKGSDLYLVLAVDLNEEYATCIQYVGNMDANDISIKLYSKPLKYFDHKAWNMPLSCITTIKDRLASYLDIKPEAVEVEKIVEKVVEKEIPGKAGAEYTKAEVDTLLAEQKAEIYEECFKVLAKGRL